MLSQQIENEGEFELKYTFPNYLAPVIDSWLKTKFERDSKYPESIVQSIYLETRDANSYQEKINSDFFKTKYRVRWYETKELYNKPPPDDFPLFLEKKVKVGAKRLKKRWNVQSNLEKLKLTNLTSHFHRTLHEILSENESGSIPHLYPFIQISYTRKRFIDSFSGARLSLDTDIRVEKTNSFILPPPTRIPLESGVFEVKSGLNESSPSLGYLVQRFVRKSTFSKYERCVSFINS